MFQWKLVIMGTLEMLTKGLNVLGPLVLQQIVEWLITPNSAARTGYLWALAMLGIPLASAFFNAHQQGLGIHAFLKVIALARHAMLCDLGRRTL